MSKINLQRGILTVENRRSRGKERICSEVSVNSPGNPWGQSRRRNDRLWWEGFAEKESVMDMSSCRPMGASVARVVGLGTELAQHVHWLTWGTRRACGRRRYWGQ